jgi:hypothetical protein
MVVPGGLLSKGSLRREILRHGLSEKYAGRSADTLMLRKWPLTLLVAGKVVDFGRQTVPGGSNRMTEQNLPPLVSRGFYRACP